MTPNHQALMAHPLGAVVAVVEAELTTPQRPTAVSKGAEVMAEAVKMERMVEAVQVGRLAEAVKAVRLAEAVKAVRLAEVVRVGRLAEAVKVERAVQAVAVVVKIRNCLKCLIPLSVMAMASLTGAVLNPMAILEHLGHLRRFQLVGRVLRILH